MWQLFKFFVVLLLSMPAGIEDFCNDTIQIELPLAKNVYDEVSGYAPPFSKPCRVEQRLREIRGTGGEVMMATVTIYFPYDIPNLVDNARLTLSDGTHPNILQIRQMKTMSAIHHITVYASE